MNITDIYSVVNYTVSNCLDILGNNNCCVNVFILWLYII